jgi:hypothetical protein
MTPKKRKASKKSSARRKGPGPAAEVVVEETIRTEPKEVVVVRREPVTLARALGSAAVPTVVRAQKRIVRRRVKKRAA